VAGEICRQVWSSDAATIKEPSMDVIKATYRVVTPMFCGGAEQQLA
jgi:hypothetical protein